jgi:hypothetical protein
MVNETNRPSSYLLPLRLWIGKKLFGADRLGSKGVQISIGRMIKAPCPISELKAMRYVAEHTSIPVPKVFNTYYYDHRLYIEMEYIHGMSLQTAWNCGHLSQDQKKYISTLLTRFWAILAR